MCAISVLGRVRLGASSQTRIPLSHANTACRRTRFFARLRRLHCLQLLLQLLLLLLLHQPLQQLLLRQPLLLLRDPHQLSRLQQAQPLHSIRRPARSGGLPRAMMMQHCLMT
jgi:hypothetical protein